MTKIDRAVSALREAAAALEDLPDAALNLTGGRGQLSERLRAKAVKLEEIQIATRPEGTPA